MPVYFIQAGEDGPVKIGWSDNVYLRLAAMQSDNYEPLTILGIADVNRDAEGDFHTRFGHLCLRGEWFTPAPEILCEAAKHPVPEKLGPERPVEPYLKNGALVLARIKYAEEISRSNNTNLGSFARRTGVPVSTLGRLINGA